MSLLLCILQSLTLYDIMGLVLIHSAEKLLNKVLSSLPSLWIYQPYLRQLSSKARDVSTDACSVENETYKLKF